MSSLQCLAYRSEELIFCELSYVLYGQDGENPNVSRVSLLDKSHLKTIIKLCYNT